jgi:hypothetical protein
MKTGLSVFEQFPNNQEAADHLVSKIVSELRDGHQDPLQARVFFKIAEYVVKESAKATDDLALNEANKYGSKRFEAHGATIELKELGTKWWYDNTNDPEYAALMAQKEALDAKIKAREKFLQTIPETGLEIVDTETGETLTINRAYKTSTSGLAISLKTKEAKA